MQDFLGLLGITHLESRQILRNISELGQTHSNQTPVELPFILSFALFLSSIVALVWMAIRILKDPYSTDKTFDEIFYQDREDIRRNGKE